MAKVAAEAKQFDALISQRLARQKIWRGILAAVVDEDHFPVFFLKSVP